MEHHAQITPAEYRNGIRVLMIECLGLAWLRANIPSGYGLYAVPDARRRLPAVPDAMLPGLYAKAQHDALALIGDETGAA